MTLRLTKFELDLAARLAEQAYDDAIPGAFKYESKIGACAYLYKHDDKQYVIYRGTNSAIDWAANASCLPWRVGGKWVHAGFAISQKSVWKPIRKQLDPAKVTYCIGHSLGGASATVAALRLLGHGFSKDKIRLVTFGRPNVMWRAKAPSGLGCNVSVVSGSDIVAVIPRLLTAAPDCDIIYCGNDDKDYLNPPKEFRDQDRRSHLKELISDHMMDTSYKPRVKNLDLEKLCVI